MYNQKSYAALFFDELEEYQELESRLIAELENDGNNTHLLNNLGLIQYELGDITKAEKYFKESAAHGNAQALETLCDLYAKTSRVKNALDTIYSLIESETDPYRIGVYHRTVARCHLSSNDVDSAIEEYKKSLIVDPEFKNTYLLMAECLEKNGQSEKGREYRVKYGKTKNL